MTREVSEIRLKDWTEECKLISCLFKCFLIWLNFISQSPMMQINFMLIFIVVHDKEALSY
jgi:hypothetical protein